MYIILFKKSQNTGRSFSLFKTASFYFLHVQPDAQLFSELAGERCGPQSA